jgi:hypothetical protein
MVSKCDPPFQRRHRGDDGGTPMANAASHLPFIPQIPNPVHIQFQIPAGV